MHADDVILPPKYVLRDNDVKYRKVFDDVFKATDAEVVRNTPRSPNLRAHVERFIQSHQVDLLNKFVVVSERHLNHINREFQHRYNHDRPHSARDHLPPGCEEPPAEVENLKTNDIICNLKLGGALKSYSWRAA